MNTGRPVCRCLRLIVAFLLTVLIIGCGGSDSDETVPALVLNGFSPSTTSRTRPLSGTIEAGATLQVTVDTAAVVKDLQVVGDKWDCTIDALVPGTNLVTILAKDATGNQKVLLLSLVYEALTIERWVTPIPGNTVTIGGLVDQVAAAENIVVSVEPAGQADPPLITRIGREHWQAVLTGLADGDNVITVTFTPNGLEQVQRTQTVTVDQTAPLVTINLVDSPTPDDEQTVRGERESDLNVIPSASPATAGDPDLTTDPQAWSALLTDLSLGKNPFTVSVTSEDGITATAHDLIVRDPPFAPAQ
jgi:hypothetical protein